MADRHRLLFLAPGHFHAALTLRVPHPRVDDEIVVYAPDGAERRDFLALVARFNARPAEPARWRPTVVTADDPLARLLEERRGDVVVLAGRNGGKARTIHRLHDGGFHVLADKPWLVGPGDLDDVRASLADWPLAMEIMTGRHDLPARLLKRLVDAPAVFGGFRDVAPAVELDGVHHLAKLVDGVPLRRPWWFFDVRVQGRGLVDIPTHLVDRTQWLLDGVAGSDVPRLISARTSSTRVPEDVFCRITGEPGFPAELRPRVEGGALIYECNAVLEFRIGDVSARAGARWELAAAPGGGDISRTVVRGTLADLRLEQGPHTGNRRRLTVEPREGAGTVAGALGAIVDAWQAELPGVAVHRGAAGYEVAIPEGLDAGHETHFTRVLDAFLRAVDERRWPAALNAGTLAKYALLAEALAPSPVSGTRARSRS